MAQPVTKYSALISRPERVPELVRVAVRAATTGRFGPAFLAIPDELLAEKIETSKLRLTPASQQPRAQSGRGRPGADPAGG